ncbi:MAG TPA: outer membrane beta-barrel protein [Bryobacteraceae bacterium]|nr:outer membrane beta-barrel protein [Bryobacteraceae bacterium]
MKFATIAALLVCASPLAFSQNFEGSISLGVSQQSNNNIGSFVNSTTNLVQNLSLNNGFRFGFRVTLNSWKYFGHEFGYAYSRTGLHEAGVADQGFGIHTGFYDFLAYARPEGSRIRPFAAGGVHFSNYVPPGASAQYGQGDNKFGVNYGGGVKVKLFGNWGARFDIRQYDNPKPFGLAGANGWIKMLEVSGGVAFML